MHPVAFRITRAQVGVQRLNQRLRRRRRKVFAANVDAGLALVHPPHEPEQDGEKEQHGLESNGPA